MKFLDRTTSGGVTRSDGIVHAFAPGAHFGGVGNSGTGAYHGKVGFGACTHRRTVVSAEAPLGMSDGLAGVASASEDVSGMVQQATEEAVAAARARVAGIG